MFDDETREKHRDGQALLCGFALQRQLDVSGYVPAYEFITF
jgi:hypothetical protein